MKRLSFSQIVTELKAILLPSGFANVGEEVFVGRGNAAVLPWVSLAGSEFLFAPVLGVWSKNVDQIVGKALRKAVPNFVPGKFAVPLFRTTPEKISPGALRIIRLRTGEPGFSATEVAEFSEWLTKTGLPFLLEHSTLQAALEFALKWNRGDQAQQYYVPALMLLLGMQNEKEAYVNEVIDSFEPSARELVSTYLQFLQELDAVVANERRNQ